MGAIKNKIIEQADEIREMDQIVTRIGELLGGADAALMSQFDAKLAVEILSDAQNVAVDLAVKLITLIDELEQTWLQESPDTETDPR